METAIVCPECEWGILRQKEFDSDWLKCPICGYCQKKKVKTQNYKPKDMR